MLEKTESYQLTNSELDIMEILWNSPEPLKATDLLNVNPKLNLATVRARLHRLLSKNFITVAKYEISGTVNARCYVSAIPREEYRKQNGLESLLDFLTEHDSISIAELVVTLLDQREDASSALAEVDQLEAAIGTLKQKLTDKLN